MWPDLAQQHRQNDQIRDTCASQRKALALQREAVRHQRETVRDQRESANEPRPSTNTLTATFRQPFDLLAITNTTWQRKKAAGADSSDLRPIWLPTVDNLRNFLLTATAGIHGM